MLKNEPALRRFAVTLTGQRVDRAAASIRFKVEGAPRSIFRPRLRIRSARDPRDAYFRLVKRDSIIPLPSSRSRFTE